MYKNSIFISLTVLFLVICSIPACRTVRRPKHGYAWVPVKEALARPSDKQERVLSSEGTPQVIWFKPLGPVLWVYCQEGVPTRVVEFGEQVRVLEEGFSTRGDLCERPVDE